MRKIPLNRVVFVPNNEPLLGILDKFQEGRSHMAIVSRFSMDQAVSVKKAVKRGLTQRLKDRVGMGDSDSSSSSSSDSEDDETSTKGSPVLRRKPFSRVFTKDDSDSEHSTTVKSDGQAEPDVREVGSSTGKRSFRVGGGKRKKKTNDIEMGIAEEAEGAKSSSSKVRMGNLTLPKASFGRWEQNMPADAVLTKQGADEVCFLSVISRVALLTSF